jgi:hypothetical protein
MKFQAVVLLSEFSPRSILRRSIQSQSSLLCPIDETISCNLFVPRVASFTAPLLCRRLFLSMMVIALFVFDGSGDGGELGLTRLSSPHSRPSEKISRKTYQSNVLAPPFT